MSYVDSYFINDLERILAQDWEVDNRSKWGDGSKPKTKRIIQVSHKYDLSKGFPISKLREINFPMAVDEMVWIYIKLSNNIKDLKSKIWKSWSDSEGYIHKAYGYQIAKPTMGFESQIHYILNEIKTNPTSRRIQMNMFNAEDQLEKATKSLIECAFGTKFSVKDGKLHMTLDQRGGDFLTAAGSGGWNVSQYASLQFAIAKECNLDVGILKHDIQDLHLYDHHINQAKEILSRYKESGLQYDEPYNLPKLAIADKPFFELTSEDFKLEGYNHLGKIGRIEVSV